jgi:protein-tyrosine-phosphatase
MKILIICASNICRSPYVEYILKREIEKDPVLKENIEWVKSAAVINKMFRIHPLTKKALLKESFTEEEINRHKPAYIYFNYKRFHDADVIIGMKKHQKYFMPPTLYKKFITLAEAAGEQHKEILDPFFAKTPEGFDNVMEELKSYSMKYLEKLRVNKIKN